MVTMTSVTSVKPQSKPARSITHPLREPKPGYSRKGKGDGRQFDPDELKRKLEAHLTHLNIEAEQRRTKPDNSQGMYHHVPKFAAADFARTATPEPMGQKEKNRGYAYKVAQAALKHQAVEETQLAGSFDLKQTQALDKVRKQRDLIAERNQFQRTRDLEDAAYVDKERKLNSAPRRTFRNSHLEADQGPRSCRPLSTGDLNWDDDTDAVDPIFHVKQKPKVFNLPTANDRQDWAQRDELSIDIRRSVKERVTPLLRKPDSKWMLKSKKEPRAEGSLPKTNPANSTARIKNKKSIFQSLFRR